MDNTWDGKPLCVGAQRLKAPSLWFANFLCLPTYKSTNGIKRHLAVDTLGFPCFTHCTKANLSDDMGLIEMLTKNIDYFQSKPVNIPKITILLDRGYHPQHLRQELQKVYPQIMTKIRFELSAKLLRARKGSARGIWVDSGCDEVGDSAVECLDGAMQNPR